MSLATSLLGIIAQDTGGVLTGALNNFNTAIQGTSDIQEVVAAGVQFESTIVTSLPAVESSLIKDTTKLLVTDAVNEITALQTQAAAAGSSGGTSSAQPAASGTAPS
jgi:hypothetical protein